MAVGVWCRIGERVKERIRWYLNSVQIFDYTVNPAYRCAHVNRFGVRCFRSWTYDHFCGLHNAVCWDTGTGKRHNWRGGGHR